MTDLSVKTEYYPPPELPQGSPARRPEPQQPQGDLPPEEQQTPRSPGSRMIVVALILVIAISVAFILRGLVFTIRNVRVVGVSRLGWRDVALSAGLSPASNYFNLDEARIRDGINTNRYLIFERMERVLPNTVVFYVRERRPSARINYIGIAYIMAEDGIILERTKDLSQYTQLLSVSGLAIRDIRQGAVPLSTRGSQMDVCISLIRELQLQGFDSQIVDVNVSEPSSLFITSNDGFSIHLGDSKDLRAKIGTARAVLQACRTAGYQRGVIEATVPGFATYRPESV